MNLLGSTQPLLRKSWRALSYDWLEYQQFSDDACLVCLTKRQLAWLQSNVTYYAWPTRWENLGITLEELSHEAVELEFALMTCIDIQPYQIEFSYNQAVLDALASYLAAYGAGGITELNPNTPTDFYSGDGSVDRVAALCTASNIYVLSYATNWLTKAQAILDVTMLIAFALALTGVGGLIAGTVLAGLAFVTHIAVDAMQDNVALNNVICCMNVALNNAAVSQANFISSLDNCNFTVGSNEAIIRDIIASDLNQLANWLSFLNSLGDAYVLAQLGTSICPCPQPPKTVIVTFDTLTSSEFVLTFGNAEIPNILSPIVPQNSFGNPLPSALTNFGTSNSGQFGIAMRVFVKLPQVSTISNISFDFFYVNNIGSLLTTSIRLLDEDLNVILEVFNTAVTAKNVWKTYAPVASAGNVVYIAAHVAVFGQASQSQNTLSCSIDNITFTQVT